MIQQYIHPIIHQYRNHNNKWLLTIITTREKRVNQWLKFLQHETIWTYTENWKSFRIFLNKSVVIKTTFHCGYRVSSFYHINHDMPEYIQKRFTRSESATILNNMFNYYNSKIDISIFYIWWYVGHSSNVQD